MSVQAWSIGSVACRTDSAGPPCALRTTLRSGVTRSSCRDAAKDRRSHRRARSRHSHTGRGRQRSNPKRRSQGTGAADPADARSGSGAPAACFRFHGRARRQRQLAQAREAGGEAGFGLHQVGIGRTYARPRAGDSRPRRSADRAASYSGYDSGDSKLSLMVGGSNPAARRSPTRRQRQLAQARKAGGEAGFGLHQVGIGRTYARPRAGDSRPRRSADRAASYNGFD